MNFTTGFKPAIASFLNRDATLFVAGTTDLILLCANKAKAYAQRKHTFNHAATVVKLTINSIDGVEISGAKDLNNVTTKVKLIKAASINGDAGAVPIGMISRSAQHARARRLTEGCSLEELQRTNLHLYEKPALVRFGNSVMLWPWPGTTEVLLDVVKWMPDYVPSTNETDFFLDECFDWTFYQTLVYLNYFLKEDERVVISDKLMKDAWNSVVAWDTDYESSTPVED